MNANCAGLKMIDRGIPRHDYELTDKDGNVIGRVTSGTMSPILNKGIGMAYVHKAYSTIGTEVFLNVRNKMLKAKIVKMPVYQPSVKRGKRIEEEGSESFPFLF